MMSSCSSVPTIASSIPSSPASTPRRAVVGELIHFSERMNSAVATKYVISMAYPLLSNSFMVSWVRWP